MDKIQDEIIGEFSVFDDWLDKYDYLIELSDALPPIDAAHRTDRYLINGCQSRVWIDARLEGGQVSTIRPTATPSSPRASSRCSSAYSTAARRRTFSQPTSTSSTRSG